MAASAAADPLRPTQRQQIELGLRAAKEVRQKEKVLPASDARVQTLRRVGRRLLSTLDARKEPWQYSFDVIESKELNAFALPGGPVFFYTGILEKIKTEDELAAILAHEITHVRREHWAYQYRDQQQRNLLLGLAVVFGGVNSNTAAIADLGFTVFKDLKFSRRHETESDLAGVDMMAAAGYNPEGMALVFEMLGRESGGGKPPEWLSTHPSDKTRSKRIRDHYAKMNRTFPALRPLQFKG